MGYFVKLTEVANRDIEKVIDYIENELFALVAAEKFLRGIYAEIARLKVYAGIYAVSTYRDVLKYGDNARRINYKEFTIIYTIHGNIVLIHRIIHGSMIKE
jgi:plasmid stabilization system protein ParE